MQTPQGHQTIIHRFVAACQDDERIVAAFLRGSHASGTADEFSDLDLSLITSDISYDDFVAGREAFVRLLGEPVFFEDFDSPDIIFFTFADGTECELTHGRESQFNHINLGPYETLLDKQGILEGVVFSGRTPTHAEQIETLRRLVHWFWHDLSHFTTAIARGQLWWGYGQLEILRLSCVNLAHLSENFSVEPEGYDKLESLLDVERLSVLQSTFCPMEREVMLRAAIVIVQLYRELAAPMAETQGIPYPTTLDRVLYDRLEKLCTKLLS